MSDEIKNVPAKIENQGPVTDSTGEAFKQACLIILDHESFFYSINPTRLDSDTYQMVTFKIGTDTFIMRRPKSKDNPELHYCEAVLERIEDVEGVAFSTYYFLGTKDGVNVGESAYDIPAKYAEAYEKNQASEFWESDEYNQEMRIKTPTEDTIQTMLGNFVNFAINIDNRLKKLLAPVYEKIDKILVFPFEKDLPVNITDKISSIKK